MIFVAVGTTDFDILAQTMDRLSPLLDENVTIQIGQGRYQPQYADYFRFSPSLEKYYKEASLVVAHGGMGITLEVLGHNKPLVSVSNPDRYDNHQDDILGALEAEGYLLWCKELSQLSETLTNARRTTFKKYTRPACHIADIIGEFLVQEKKQRAVKVK